MVDLGRTGASVATVAAISVISISLIPCHGYSISTIRWEPVRSAKGLATLLMWTWTWLFPTNR